MPRARNIKPSFFVNDDLAEISPLGRLLFIGLWTIADREGRLEDKPKKIKVQVLPYDDCDINDILNDLQEKGFILRYKTDKCPCRITPAHAGNTFPLIPKLISYEDHPRTCGEHQ